jgi:hypothetical protein
MRIATALSAAAACLVAVPAAAANAAAPGQPSPVTITRCSGGISSIELIEIAAYNVTFHNTAFVAADEIRFGARYGRHESRAEFDVKGVFPPGADVNRKVSRTVRGGLFAYRSEENDCTVDYVHFTNGTSWTRPGSPNR